MGLFPRDDECVGGQYVGSIVEEVWLRYLSGPCVEFGWYVDVSVDVVQLVVVIPNDAVHLSWICFTSTPLEIKEGAIINGKASKGGVLLPLAGLLICW